MFRRLSGPSFATFGLLPNENDIELMREAYRYFDDFAFWPSSREEIIQRIRRLLRPSDTVSESIGERLLQDVAFAQLVGEDPAFLQALAKISIVAKSGAPVLITGESGTGKELSARAIHHLGKRRMVLCSG